MASQPIKIEKDLYNRLRDYCDIGGIRFVDFVEEALENAIEREEILEKSAKADEVLKRADKNMKRSFRRGFWQGFVAGFLASQGQFALSERLIPSEVSYREDPFKLVSGNQLSLFDET
jgi:hypothetical protein